MADSGRYELSQIPMESGIKPAADSLPNPHQSYDGSASFIMFLQLYMPICTRFEKHGIGDQ
jgi:hypothetical protein